MNDVIGNSDTTWQIIIMVFNIIEIPKIANPSKHLPTETSMWLSGDLGRINNCLTPHTRHDRVVCEVTYIPTQNNAN